MAIVKYTDTKTVAIINFKNSNQDISLDRVDLTYISLLLSDKTGVTSGTLYNRFNTLNYREYLKFIFNNTSLIGLIIDMDYINKILDKLEITDNDGNKVDLTQHRLTCTGRIDEAWNDYIINNIIFKRYNSYLGIIFNNTINFEWR